MVSRAYIYLEKKYQKEAIELLNSLFLDKCYIDFENNLGKIEVVDEDCFELILRNFINIQSDNLQTKISILIVPYFNNVFNKYIDYVYENINTIADIFIKNSNDINVKNDIKLIRESLNKKHIETIKALLSCNMNIVKASEVLYLHRNSINYRLNNFKQDTNMDIRDINTILFLKIVM